MPRIGRLVVKNEQAVYHVMSRTALDGYPLGDLEKEFLVDVIRKKSRIYFVDILGFCIMGNHFHLLVRMLPETGFTDEICDSGSETMPETVIWFLPMKIFPDSGNWGTYVKIYVSQGDFRSWP